MTLTRLAIASLASLVLALPALSTAATITLTGQTSGTTPTAIGYNLAHWMAGSNAADLWRYSGLRLARAFISASHIEPTDDLAPLGDGVTDGASFNSRASALRAHVRADRSLTGSAYVNWPAFKANYAGLDPGANNAFSIDHAFGSLRSMGVHILANISCSPSRFPLAGETDWAGKWEIWQHYYAQAFYLASKFDVSRFGIMNEPNNWSPAITPEAWHLRLRITSDAIQAALADVNAATGKSLVANIHAPNTANGATKYDDPADNWGQLAVTQRHLRLDGSRDAAWLNFHTYNYQKYSTLQRSTDSASGFLDDFNTLTAKIAKDTAGQPMMPIALTEMNSRTGQSYDGRTNHADTPEDYASLGASLVSLAGASELYVFKFGMTASDGAYPVAKNGTHYADNAGATRSYGGPASTAEVVRLFNRASGSMRPRVVTTGAPTDVWTLATRDTDTGETLVFVANKTATAQSLDFDVSALGVLNGSTVWVQEVSAEHKGGIRTISATSGGRVPSLLMPAQSVWLVTISPVTRPSTSVLALENALLRDGKGRTATGANPSDLLARSDGTANGRSVSVIKFALPNATAGASKVLLRLRAATISRNTAVQVHVYGLANDAWRENSVTFSSLPQLKQRVAAGNEIANNVVEDGRQSTRLLGQVWVKSTTPIDRHVDVTEFVRSRTGYASFLVVQEHRWTRTNHLKSGTGDTQADGLRIRGRRNAGAEPALQVFTR